MPRQTIGQSNGFDRWVANRREGGAVEEPRGILREIPSPAADASVWRFQRPSEGTDRQTPHRPTHTGNRP